MPTYKTAEKTLGLKTLFDRMGVAEQIKEIQLKLAVQDPNSNRPEGSPEAPLVLKDPSMHKQFKALADLSFAIDTNASLDKIDVESLKAVPRETCTMEQEAMLIRIISTLEK